MWSKYTTHGIIMKWLYSTFLMLFFFCSRVSCSGTAEYGVGFHLALDYGWVEPDWILFIQITDLLPRSTASI